MTPRAAPDRVQVLQRPVPIACCSQPFPITYDFVPYDLAGCYGGFVGVWLLRTLLLLSVTCSARAEQAEDYLQLAAKTYKQLRSLQVEAEVRRSRGNEEGALTAIVTLYSVPPQKARVETKDTSRNLHSVLVSNGHIVAEYRPHIKQYTVLPLSTLAVNFAPERGMGWGEMLYDSIADRVRQVSIRGQESLDVGRDRIRCVIVDVDYGVPGVRYSFWIATGNGLIIRRVATVGTEGKTEVTVSTVRALTMNEAIPAAVFEVRTNDDQNATVAF
jgi:outer membrane lipoprotein-sorting protein